MKKNLIITCGIILLFITTNAQPFGQHAGNPSPTGPFPLDGNTIDRVRSIGIGQFSNLNATTRTRARLHVRNDFLYDPNGPYNGQLFRTDGQASPGISVDNNWKMFTGTVGAYNEIFKLEVPGATNHFVIQNTTSNGSMKFNTNGNNLRAIITSNGDVGINTPTPGNKFELNSGILNTSGFRFTQLTSLSPVSGSSNKVLSVNGSGDVILVTPTGIGGTCAQNGLNCTVASPLIEMGGNLLHATNVTKFHPTLLVRENMGFNGKGQFIITDYRTGTNSSAGSIPGLRYEAGVFTDTNQFALEVENKKLWSPINTQGGIEVNVDLNNNGTLNTRGINAAVLGNGANFYGIIGGVNARTLGGINDAAGVSGSAVNANHCWGGSFNAITNVPVPPGSSAHAIGVSGYGSGGALAYGGQFEATNAKIQNVGVYARAFVTGAPGVRHTGVKAIAHDANPGNINYGVESCAQNVPAGQAIAVRGTLAQANIPFSVYPNAHIAVMGDANNYTPFSFPSGPTPRWAGYFLGNVNVNGLLYTTSGGVLISDQSLKKNVKKVEGALAILGKLSPKSYDLYNDNCKQLNFEGTKTQFGLIAQEVEKVLPQIVYDLKVPATMNEKGETSIPEKDLKGINYGQLIPLLIKGTQEQQSQIETQSATIQEQKKQIEDLKEQQLQTAKEQQKQIDELKSMVQSLATNQNSIGSKAAPSQAVNLSDKNVIVLNQNVPNPFAESTVITYNIPTDFTKAQISFSTADGKIIKSVDITSKGEGRLNVFANDLTNGFYTYTLVVDGKIIDTKKMVKD